MPEVTILGTIERAFGFKNTEALYCVFELSTPSSSWTLLEGKNNGQTHTADCETNDPNWTAEWAHPIQATYSTSSMDGWPTLCVYVWSLDEFHRNEICGYGTCRIPPCPGQHSLNIYTWVPETSWKDWLLRKFVGGGPQLLDTSLLTHSGGNRSHLRTRSTGFVSVQLNVLLRGFAEHGVVFQSISKEHHNPSQRVQQAESSMFSYASPSAFASTIGNRSDAISKSTSVSHYPGLRTFGYDWIPPETLSQLGESSDAPSSLPWEQREQQNVNRSRTIDSSAEFNVRNLSRPMSAFENNRDHIQTIEDVASDGINTPSQEIPYDNDNQGMETIPKTPKHVRIRRPASNMGD